MKRVILVDQEAVSLSDVPEDAPIFAKSKDGKICGMVLNDNIGWIIKTGGANSCSGHHSTRLGAMRDGMRRGFTYFVESE